MPNDDYNPKNLFSIEGKRIFLTGASSGLGRHFGWSLAKAGATLILAARSVDKLNSLAAEIKDFGGNCEVSELDARDRVSIRASIAATEERGPIDVLINNAGIAIVKSPQNISDEDWDTVYETNLRGPWTLAQDLIRRRLEDGRALSIINVASILGVRAIGHLAPYAAAKAGLINLSRDLCVDLATKNIRVNALLPGYIETEMNKDWLKTEGGERLRQKIPARRFGLPSDLDGALIYLASDASSFVNGSVITVDGGQSASL